MLPQLSENTRMKDAKEDVDRLEVVETLEVEDAVVVATLKVEDEVVVADQLHKTPRLPTPSLMILTVLTIIITMIFIRHLVTHLPYKTPVLVQ